MSQEIDIAALRKAAQTLSPGYMAVETSSMLALLDRLEQAEKERDELKAGLPTIRINIDASEALAGIEGAQEIVKDAARYRWLRSCGIVEYKKVTGSVGPGMLPSGYVLDALVDTAMQGEGA